MKSIYINILLFCLSMFPISMLANNDSLSLNDNHISAETIKMKADSAFAAEDFALAETLYLELANQGESASIYYNLGCTYYRQDMMAKAVLWFERALLLDPSDSDIRFNLSMARGKTVDRIIPKHEMFFVSLWKSLMHNFSVSEWAYWAITTFILSLLMVALYLYSSTIVLRKVGFFACIFCLLLCVLFNTLAYSLRNYNNTHTAGIIMEPAVTVKSTPTKSGTELFVIHEGTRVEIKDNSMREWAEVQIADGKIGWIEKNTFEAI